MYPIYDCICFKNGFVLLFENSQNDFFFFLFLSEMSRSLKQLVVSAVAKPSPVHFRALRCGHIQNRSKQYTAQVQSTNLPWSFPRAKQPEWHIKEQVLQWSSSWRGRVTFSLFTYQWPSTHLSSSMGQRRVSVLRNLRQKLEKDITPKFPKISRSTSGHWKLRDKNKQTHK